MKFDKEDIHRCKVDRTSDRKSSRVKKLQEYIKTTADG